MPVFMNQVFIYVFAVMVMEGQRDRGRGSGDGRSREVVFVELGGWKLVSSLFNQLSTPRTPSAARHPVLLVEFILAAVDGEPDSRLTVLSVKSMLAMLCGGKLVDKLRCEYRPAPSRLLHMIIKRDLPSPGCLDSDWPNLPPITPPSRVLFTVLRFFRWAHVSIISAPSNLWESTGQEVASALQSLGLPIGPVVTMETKNNGGAREALRTIKDADKVKVVIMCMSSVLIGGEDQRELLLTALEMGMVSDGYIFIPYDALLYAMPYQDAVFPQLTNSMQLRHAYSSVLTVTMASDQSFYEAFRQAQMSQEIRSAVSATEVSPVFGTIFNMVYFVAKAVEERRQAGGGHWVTGNRLVQSDGGFDFQGFNQVLYGGREGRGLQARYMVLNSDGDRLVPTHSLAPTHTDGTVGGLRPLSRSFTFPGGKPPTDSFCWFSPEEACSGGVDTVPVFFIFLLLCALIGAFSYWIRKYKRAANVTKLILTLDDIVFIDTQVSRK
ncbi:guanylyl cyclase GC-E-like protein, partial [Lates japonicus]